MLFLLRPIRSSHQCVWLDLSSLLVKGRLEGVARLDADVFSAEVVLSVLNILIDNVCRLHEGSLDVVPGLGAGLHEQKVVLVRKLLALLGADLSLQLQVVFVSDQKYYHLGVGVVTHVVEPASEVVEGAAASDVVDEQGADATTVVASGD